MGEGITQIVNTSKCGKQMVDKVLSGSSVTCYEQATIPWRAETSRAMASAMRCCDCAASA